MTKLADDTLITPTLLRRFELEAQQEEGPLAYYALLRQSNGNLLAHHPFGLPASPPQLIWASEVLRLVNTEIDHGGAWVVCFTHPIPSQLSTVLHDPKHTDYGRYCLIWIDADGDPQFTQEWMAGENSDFTHFAHVIAAGIHSTVQKCETSWQTWKLMMKDVLDVRAGQTFKKAKGERAASAPH